ncbi:MAG: T9SS type A sorting domain-containing protein [Bacteroidota bacterium]
MSAQYFEPVSQHVYGGLDYDRVSDLVQVEDGSYFILSETISGADGNKTVPRYGEHDYSSDAWLIKTDSLFNEIWQLGYGSFGSEIPRKLLVDDAGYLYLCVSSDGDVSGTKTVNTYGMKDFWIVKLDQNGQEIWQKSYGGESSDYVQDAGIYNGNLYFTGTSSSDSSGVKTSFNRGELDYWLLCTDTSGNIVFDKTYGGTGYDRAMSIQFDQASNTCYISGLSDSPVSYEKTEESMGGRDYWVVKADADNGEKLDDFVIGSDGWDDLKTCLLWDNHLYLFGDSSGDDYGDKTEISRGQRDYWLVKSDLSGNVIWDKTLGSDTLDIAYDMLISNNTLILSGHSMSDAGYEKTEDAYIHGNYDGWFVGMDTTGAVLWDKILGSFESDLWPVLFKTSNNIAVGMGTLSLFISGDLTESTYVPEGTGDPDNWLFRMTVPTLNVKESVSELNASLYPNPATTKIHVHLPDARTAELSMYSLSGKLLMKANVNGPQEIIDISSLKSGMYMVEIRQNNSIKRSKLVVE